MARNSVKAMALPNVETTLVIRPPTYSVVSKCTKLTSPAALAVIPPLNACMDVRKRYTELPVNALDKWERGPGL